MKTRFIPSSDAAFHSWQGNLMSKVSSHAPAWNIPTDAVVRLQTQWAVLPEPPKSYADLVHSMFDTRSPYTFQFDLADAGKTLYVCARWENTIGQKGPWSEIKSVIIP